MCNSKSPFLVWEASRRDCYKGSVCLAFRQKGKGQEGVVFSALPVSQLPLVQKTFHASVSCLEFIEYDSLQFPL